MATGFHGFHVIIGTIFLTVCLFRAIAGQFTPTRHFGFEAAAWYWHFVDVVWLFLFACIYVWGEGPRRSGLRLTHTAQHRHCALFSGLCPRCGQGPLFDGYIALQNSCPACGLDYAMFDAGDGPVVFGILIVGAIVCGLALWVEFTFSPPYWVHAVLWLPLICLLTGDLPAPVQIRAAGAAIQAQGGRRAAA